MLPHWEIGMQEGRMMFMLLCEDAQETSKKQSEPGVVQAESDSKI